MTSRRGPAHGRGSVANIVGMDYLQCEGATLERPLDFF